MDCMTKILIFIERNSIVISSDLSIFGHYDTSMYLEVPESTIIFECSRGIGYRISFYPIPHRRYLKDKENASIKRWIHVTQQ